MQIFEGHGEGSMREAFCTLIGVILSLLCACIPNSFVLREVPMGWVRSGLVKCANLDINLAPVVSIQIPLVYKSTCIDIAKRAKAENQQTVHKNQVNQGFESR